MDGYYLTGFGDGGEQPHKPLRPLPGAFEDARKELAQRPETQHRMQRVGRLIEGFETPYGLKLLATTHWILTRQSPADEDDLVRCFHGWSKRKARFDPSHIHQAASHLRECGWLPTALGDMSKTT